MVKAIYRLLTYSRVASRVALLLRNKLHNFLSSDTNMLKEDNFDAPETARPKLYVFQMRHLFTPWRLELLSAFDRNHANTPKRFHNNTQIRFFAWTRRSYAQPEFGTD